MARRTQAQLAETRQAIISAAKTLFAEKGLMRTQVAEIAQQAGIGMSAFYGQFEDKHALFLVIISEVFTELHAHVLTVRRRINLRDLVASMHDIQLTYEMFFETVLRHREIVLSVFRSGFSAIPGLEAWYWQMCDAVAAEMSRDLMQGQTAGVIRVDHPREMADAMIGMMQQLAYRMVLTGTPSVLEAAQMCTRHTLGSLFFCMPPEVLRVAVTQMSAMQRVGQASPLLVEQDAAMRSEKQIPKAVLHTGKTNSTAD